MKTCTIYFSNSPIGKLDTNGTNTVFRNQLEEKPSTGFSITWAFENNSTAEKVFNNLRWLQSSNDIEVQKSQFMSWNKYTHENKANILAELNKELEYCTEKGYVNFTDDYYVYPDQDADTLLYRLNAIHYAFENELRDVHRKNFASGPEDFVVSLERLNKLVHIAEDPNIETERYHYVVRNDVREDLRPWPKTEDSDFANFNMVITDGDLYSDFYTIGKDLGHAFYTNDVDLVKNQEVKPQSIVSASVCFEFSEENFGKSVSDFAKKDQYDRYYAWCKEHGVKDYGYNYTEPKYYLGRAKIARLADPKPLTYYLENLKNYPYVVRVEVNE